MIELHLLIVEILLFSLIIGNSINEHNHIKKKSECKKSAGILAHQRYNKKKYDLSSHW